MYSNRFQFYKVRLKQRSCKHWLITELFQFYKVRLKPAFEKNSRVRHY